MKYDKQAISQIVADVCRMAGNGSDLATQQMSDVTQQYLSYGRLWYTSCSCVLAATCIFCFLIMVAMGRKIAEREKAGFSSDESYGVSALITAGSAIASFVYFVICMKTTVMVWSAPKVWLMQELAGLVK